jgi:hypothetical protein
LNTAVSYPKNLSSFPLIPYKAFISHSILIPLNTLISHNKFLDYLEPEYTDFLEIELDALEDHLGDSEDAYSFYVAFTSLRFPRNYRIREIERYCGGIYA